MQINNPASANFALGFHGHDQRLHGLHFSSISQLKLLAKSDEMGKKAVPVGLETEMHNFIEMIVVEVSKYTKHLLIHFFDHRKKMGRKRNSLLGGKKGLVIKFGRDPCQDIVNEGGCGQPHLLAITVDPCIIDTRTGIHGRACFKVGNDAIKLVEVSEELENVQSDPLLGIHVLWKHDNGLKSALYQSGTHKRLA